MLTNKIFEVLLHAVHKLMSCMGFFVVRHFGVPQSGFGRTIRDLHQWGNPETTMFTAKWKTR